MAAACAAVVFATLCMVRQGIMWCLAANSLPSQQMTGHRDMPFCMISVLYDKRHTSSSQLQSAVAFATGKTTLLSEPAVLV